MTNSKMTQEEFDAIERDKLGIKHIPAKTDLSLISSFGEDCSFGVGCSFGAGCRFGEDCSFGVGCSFGAGCRFGERCSFGECCQYSGQEFKRYYQFGGFGSVGRTTRVYLLTNNTVLIECGCQVGRALSEFKDRVEEEYSESSRHGTEYRAVISVIETIVKHAKQENKND